MKLFTAIALILTLALSYSQPIEDTNVETIDVADLTPQSDELFGRNVEEANIELEPEQLEVVELEEDDEDLSGRNSEFEPESEADLKSEVEDLTARTGISDKDLVGTLRKEIDLVIPVVDEKAGPSIEEIEAELDAQYNEVETPNKKNVLAVIVKTPKLPAAPKTLPDLSKVFPVPIDIEKLLAAAKKLPKKKKVATAGIVTVAGKVIKTLVAAPKIVAKAILLKPLVHLAKKKALLGGAVHLLGKKVMGVGAGIGLVGAKTAGLGAAKVALPLKAVSQVPGVKGLVSKGASFIPGLGFVNTLATKGLSGAITSGLTSVVSSPYLSWLWNNPTDGQTYLVSSPYLDIVKSSQ